ncbi:MAG: hypothetical protein KGP28_07050 [Bdellovibrionales bacterium]|nr:hypothetical protein [Bdellovibrionales bacterium]
MSLFEQLREKLGRETGPDFDLRMSRALDSEIGSPQIRKSKLFAPMRLLIPTAAMAAALVLYFSSNPNPPVFENHLFVENVEFLQSLETIGSIDEEELIGASDEEWAEVLEGLES